MRSEAKVKTGEAQTPAKILVVEDEPNMVAGLRDNFEFEGYTVITARDGVEACSERWKSLLTWLYLTS